MNFKLNRYSFSITILFFSVIALAQKNDSIQLRKIYDFYLTESKCYSNLEHLCKKIGPRLSGSKGAEDAVAWAKKAMYEAGADTVILQPCMVPHWVRGKAEQCQLIEKNKSTKLNVTALGSSVGTGEKGIKALIIEVKNFEELEKLGEKNIKGKIVFYNVFFNQAHVKTGSAYGETVKFRSKGASYAAKYGAVATLVRSMTSLADDEPHTGNMNYDTSVSKIKIPSLALSYVAADKLSQAIKNDPTTLVELKCYCETLPDVLSYNVIGQINGSTNKNNYIVAGGHLDAWDNGEGAHDDGAGVVQCMEILRLYKKLGVKPKNNIRAIAFMNEENGLRGGEAYAKFAKENNEKHLAALETDAGGHTPRGFGVDTLNGLYKKVMTWQKLLAPYFADRIGNEGGGADLIALEKLNVPCIGFEPDTQRYFDIHHTKQDTFDKIHKRELELGSAAIGALLYLLDLYY
jgi:hypothetical protein